jgi:hypothetical protein
MINSNMSSKGRTGISSEAFSKSQFLFSKSTEENGRTSYRVWTSINGKPYVIASVVHNSESGTKELFSEENTFTVYPEEKTKLEVWRYCWNANVPGNKLIEELSWVEDNYVLFLSETS